jgi:uncharacterized protein YjbI with pentapeptide repeats
LGLSRRSFLSLRLRLNVLWARVSGAAKGKPLSWKYDPKVGRVPDVWSLSPLLKGLLVLSLVGVALWSIYYLPKYQGELWNAYFTGQQRPLFVNEARRTVLQFWGGLVVLLGLYFGWRRIQATDEANRIERERNVTDRFMKAIEQLGHDQPATQIGAVFALEGIAKDSPHLASTVAETLLAFLRERCRESRQKPLGEVQAALTVLGRRPRSEHGTDQQLDLSGLFMDGYDFSRGRFRRLVAIRTSFVRANLEGADFSDGDLRGSQFVQVRARWLDVGHANVNFSVWTQADMTGLRGTRVQFKKCTLRQANLVFADLRGAWIDRSDFSGANLSRANLTDARGLYVILNGADLSDAVLSEADLRSADLRSAVLLRSAINKTKLRKANLSTAVGLSKEQYEAALSDHTTAAPPLI